MNSVIPSQPEHVFRLKTGSILQDMPGDEGPCRIFLGKEAAYAPEKSHGLQKKESQQGVRLRKRKPDRMLFLAGSTSCPAISFAGDPGPISCCWPVTAVSRKADGDRDEVNSRPEIGTPQPEGKQWKGVGTSSVGIFSGG